MVVTLEDAVVLYGNYPALAGASLHIESGEIVLLQGPNGAGKSTVLRLCAGLVPLARGRAHVLDCDLATDRESIRRRVGMLGHANGLFLDLTAAENVAFWARMVGATARECEEAMERMGLTGSLADRRASLLSAGQKRRVALATLVVRRAELWLLDEPHTSLDERGRDELDAVLREAAGAGATIVLASHERDRAHRLSSRVVTVTGGRVQP
jgi:heme ABC exporter ATP-binding subunit CcmA